MTAKKAGALQSTFTVKRRTPAKMYISLWFTVFYELTVFHHRLARRHFLNVKDVPPAFRVQASDPFHWQPPRTDMEQGNQTWSVPAWFPFIICALCIFRAASAPECIKPDYLTAPYKISFHWQKTLHSSLIPYLTDSPAVLQFSSQPQCCCPSPHRKMSSFPPVAKSCSIASCDNVLENPCGNGFTPVSSSVFCHASFSVSVVCSS